jgi:hypothetical protein
MSLPNPYDVMRRIDSCKRIENKMYMRFLFEACARGIEGAGHLTSTDRKRHTEAYGPLGKDVFVTEIEAPDLTNNAFLTMLLKINQGKVTIDQIIEDLNKKIPIAVFKVNIAKQHLEEGEGYPHRLVALPLDKRFDPWAEEMLNWFHDKGDHVAFDLNRQDNWEHITRKEPIFRGLQYTIKKYHYSLTTGKITEDKTCLAHPRRFVGHGIRHVRTDQLIKYLKFDGFDLGALVGWSMGSSSKVSQAPAQASNYAEIREAWPRYIHKLMVPFNYKTFGEQST